jgi:competence protein ComEA
MIRIVPAVLLALTLGSLPALAQGAGGRTPSASQAAASMPVNLNTADVAQLETLPGIGKVTAERIIEYRERNGGFKKIEDLMNVRGVGEQSFLKLRALVTVGEPSR